MLPSLAAWLVHLYTASGAVLAFLAVMAAVSGDTRQAFAWLALQVVIDASDGVLARRAGVKQRTPQVDGDTLDNLVDYLTYVFVPAVIVVQSHLVPASWAMPVAAALLLSSALGFSNTAAKTADHFFTGFPSYWNIVVLYLLAFGLPPIVNASVLLALAALVFAPVRFVYPSRTTVLRRTTIVFGVVWGIQMLALIRALPDVPRTLAIAALAFPVYYTGISIALDMQRRRRAIP